MKILRFPVLWLATFNYPSILQMHLKSLFNKYHARKDWCGNWVLSAGYEKDGN
jgi:hypothetical protein